MFLTLCRKPSFPPWWLWKITLYGRLSHRFDDSNAQPLIKQCRRKAGICSYTMSLAWITCQTICQHDVVTGVHYKCSFKWRRSPVGANFVTPHATHYNHQLSFYPMYLDCVSELQLVQERGPSCFGTAVWRMRRRLLIYLTKLWESVALSASGNCEFWNNGHWRPT